MHIKSKEAIFRSFTNSFKLLVDDAELLLKLAKSPVFNEEFSCTQLCRTSMIIYILALEGLINRALDSFIPAEYRKFILEREERFSILDKWEMLPLFYNKSGNPIDKSKYPWSHLKELVSIRNDFVHPKHDRVEFIKVSELGEFDQLSPNEIPENLTYPDSMGREKAVTEKDIVYPQTKISRSPYSYRPANVEIIRKVVFDVVNELDRLLDGNIKKENWYITEHMKLIYPKDANISDFVGRKSITLESRNIGTLWHDTNALVSYADSIIDKAAVHNNSEQEVVVAGMFSNILSNAKAILILCTHGYSDSSEVIVRTCLEAHFFMIACAKSDEATKNYVGKHLINRLKAINIIEANPRLFESEEGKIALASKDLVKAEIEQKKIKNLSAEDAARIAGLSDFYLAYRIHSGAVHLDPIHLSKMYMEAKDDVVDQINIGPVPKSIPDVLTTLNALMVNAIKTYGKFFNIQGDDNILALSKKYETKTDD